MKEIDSTECFFREVYLITKNTIKRKFYQFFSEVHSWVVYFKAFPYAQDGCCILGTMSLLSCLFVCYLLVTPSC